MLASSCTCALSPSRDGTAVVGMEEPGGPGNTDRADRRVAHQTLLGHRKFLQLHQSDVVLTGDGVIPLFESVVELDITERWLVSVWVWGQCGYSFRLLLSSLAEAMLCNI